MRSVWSDVRRSARSLSTTPGQSAAALLALSLGIAAPVTLYTAFRVVADDLPPIPHPERIARLYVADATTPVGRRALRATDLIRLVDQLQGTSYVIGKIHIEKLLAARARQLGGGFSLRAFMDGVFAAGMIPVSMIRWEMTGLDDEVVRLR